MPGKSGEASWRREQQNKCSEVGTAEGPVRWGTPRVLRPEMAGGEMPSLGMPGAVRPLAVGGCLTHPTLLI